MILVVEGSIGFGSLLASTKEVQDGDLVAAVLGRLQLPQPLPRAGLGAWAGASGEVLGVAFEGVVLYPIGD